MKIFYPYEYVESVFVIDYEKLYKKGYRGIIFDIDNTLVHHGEDATKEIECLFEKIHKTGIKTLILSNNTEDRIQKFLENIDSLYIHDAKKPQPENYDKAVELLGMSKKEVVMIGDQIFTDILGANRAGIASILVRFIRKKNRRYYGKRRAVESLILKCYTRNSRCLHRMGDVLIDEYRPRARKRKLFCELNPVCYQISLQKEILKRYLQNFTSKEKFATEISGRLLPNIVYESSSYLIKKGPDIDPVLQRNKAHNIKLAAEKMNGLLIHPGEVFSFWKCTGRLTRRKGYRDGRVISQNKLKAGLGGGLCNLANTIHLLILHSPLEIVEFHNHSDALAPDHGKRIPFSAGTSVSYNQVDYRFRNNTQDDIQLLVWCEGEWLHAELRSRGEFPYNYKIIEENHHFSMEDGKFYRISQIYKCTLDKKTDDCIEKKLILNNHSEVMFDYRLIPKELIR